jgi:hypothetical protein
MTRPVDSEYPPFFRKYVNLVPEDDVRVVLEGQVERLKQLTSRIVPEREVYAYAPAKWTIRQVVGHLGDAERVFGFRAFSFSRGDHASLPGFDENAYVEESRHSDTPLARLVDDLAAVRASNLTFLRTLTDEQWARSGVANDKSITVRALAYVMAGHVRHHVRVLGERYGVPL